MSEEKETLAKLSRRQFVKGAAVGAAAVAGAGVLAGCGGQETTPCPTAPPCPEATLPGVPETWDRETEVLVVGFGGAGAVAAITADDAGAEVLVLEKAPFEGGGSSRASGGFITYTTAEEANDAAEYLYNACYGLTPMDVCQAWAEEIAKTPDWLTEKGIAFMDLSAFMGPDFRGLPGASAIMSLDMLPEEGAAMNQGGPFFFQWATEDLAKRGVEILFDTPATALVQNPETKQVLGVLAQNQGKTIAIKAKKGVILCTGGFEFNEDMIGNYIRPWPIKGVGWIFNTGDGLKMAQAIGADLWHMDIIAAAGLTYVPPESKIGYWGMGFPAPSHIWVNRYAQRFACENPTWSMHQSFMGYGDWDWSMAQTTTAYKNIPFYLIFDEKMRQAGPIYSPDATVGPTILPEELGGLGLWSVDNTAEIEKGWIKKADTIKELAEAIGAGIDPDALEETVNKYNGYCEAGEDPDFSRPAAVGESANLVVLDTPPFYAMEMWPAIYSTVGGPRKNGKGQVLDTQGNVIPRLYVAGVLGHSAAHVYSTFGQNWAEIMAFGRISGRNAAAEESWA